MKKKQQQQQQQIQTLANAKKGDSYFVINHIFFYVSLKKATKNKYFKSRLFFSLLVFVFVSFN